MTPAMLISGSRLLNPKTIAAALLTKLLELTMRITGAFNALAIEAVLPISLTESIPSNNPLTPSIIPISLPFIPFIKESLTCPSLIKKESKFLDTFPVASVW